VVAAAAALVQKVARLSARQWPEAAAVHDRAERIRLRSEELVEEDSMAYLAFVAAAKAGEGVEAAQARIVEVPLEIVRQAFDVFRLALVMEAKGNPRLRADAMVARILASAAAESAALLVEVNLEPDADDPRLLEARRLVGEARPPGAAGASGDSKRRARR
jgi:formiminotetrahydrofolate cyclodeaminase